MCSSIRRGARDCVLLPPPPPPKPAPARCNGNNILPRELDPLDLGKKQVSQRIKNTRVMFDFGNLHNLRVYFCSSPWSSSWGARTFMPGSAQRNAAGRAPSPPCNRIPGVHRAHWEKPTQDNEQFWSPNLPLLAKPSRINLQNPLWHPPAGAAASEQLSRAKPEPKPRHQLTPSSTISRRDAGMPLPTPLPAWPGTLLGKKQQGQEYLSFRCVESSTQPFHYLLPPQSHPILQHQDYIHQH